MSKADKKARESKSKVEGVIANIGYRNWKRTVQSDRSYLQMVGGSNFCDKERGHQCRS